MPETSFDVVIIGSGPGGYVAAIRAGQLGLKTALIEKDPHFGGTCLHWGCIPTKAFLHDAHLYRSMKTASKFGVQVKDVTLDFDGVQSHKTRVVKSLAMGIQGLLKKNKVKTFKGHGRIRKAGLVEADGKEIAAKNIIIASGSEARTFPGMEPDGKGILTNKEILNLKKVPKSLLVIGAGAVGVEFASVFRDFGSEVTVVEMLPTLVPLEDHETAAELAKQFKKKGIDVLTETKTESIKPLKGAYECTLSSKDGKTTKLKVETVLVAVGRRPNTDDVGLDKTRVKTDRGFISVNGYMQTDEPGIYAIGDVTPTPQLAHVASAEGILAAEHIAGHEVKPIDYDKTPNVTFCDPQIASIGLSENKAKERGHKVSVGKFPFMGIGKAKIEGHAEGFAKIVADDKYGEILGIHIIHASAGELIGEASAVMAGELTAEHLSHTVHAHPTLSESIMEAAHAIYGKPIHF